MGTLWLSGNVLSSKMYHIKYKGKKLFPKVIIIGKSGFGIKKLWVIRVSGIVYNFYFAVNKKGQQGIAVATCRTLVKIK
ncbi:MAG: hypothetical protein IRZ03_11715 [Acidobacterium ailaaui]|nr:hypothetical protein [Pseudacidobacterium ailaaui]